MTEKAVHPIIRSSVPVREFDDLGEVTSVAVFPDRRRMATNSSDGMLRIWDSKNNAMLMELEGRGDAMLDMTLSRDGQLIASSDNEGYVIAWHAGTGRPLTQAFRPYPSGICFLNFSPDGATLATGSRTTKLWSTETWQLQGESLSYSGTVTCIRYSPSGELLAMATHDYNIHIWNPATKQHIANLGQGLPSVSLAWTPDGTRLLTGDRDGCTIQEWDSSTWKQVGDIWKGRTGYPWQLAMNCDGTVVASPTTNHRIRLWWFSDRRTIAIFQHTDFPCCITFSVDGKHILAGGKDKKISEWAVPEHAWPKDQASQQAQVFETKAEDSNTKTQSSVTKDCGSDTKDKDSVTKFLVMNPAVRDAFMSGDLPAAEELLTQEIDTDNDTYRSYANRSVVMARKLDWDHALDDASKSLSIQPSLMGYISKGIALCGKKQVRDAKRAFDLSSVFTDGDPRTNHILFLIKSIALFSANQHAEALRRIRELVTACPDADTTIACRVIEVYLRIQLGNNALDRACPAEAADHFTAAVNTSTSLSKSAINSRYEEFVLVLFGFDLNSLWQTANQKRCHALLRAGRLVQVFEAYRYMADMSDETMKASCLNWSIGFMQELSTFRDNAPNADATPDIVVCKNGDDHNDSISDIDSDSDIDHVDAMI